MFDHHPHQRFEPRNGKLTVSSPDMAVTTRMLNTYISHSQTPLGGLFPLALPPVTPLYANALLTTLNACVGTTLWSSVRLIGSCSRLGLRRRLDTGSDRVDGLTSIRVDHIEFDSFNQSQGTSHPDTYPSTNSAQRGSMSYDIAFTNSIAPSNGGESGLDQTVSKARSLGPDVDAKSDLSSGHPAILSSRRSRNSQLPQV